MKEFKDNSDSVELIILNEMMKKLNSIETQVQELHNKIQEPATEEKIYKLKEVMALLRIKQSKAYEILQTGELKSFKVGPEYRVTSEAIEEYKKNQGGGNLK